MMLISKLSNDSPVYWGILDLTGNHPETKALFTVEEWEELINQFNEEVQLQETTLPDSICHFFEEVEYVLKILNESFFLFVHMFDN